MKTEAEIQAEIEKKAEEHLKQERGDTQEYIELSFREGQLPRSFKQGVTLGREIEREQVRELVYMLQQKSEHDPDCSDQHETFNHLQDCECGAIQIQFAIKKYQAARGDDHE